MTKPLRTFLFVSVAIIMLAVGLLGWSVWSITWPFDPLTVNKGSWITIDSTVKRGDWLIVRVDYCQHSRITPRLDLTIEQDARLMLMTPKFGTDVPGCFKEEIPLLQIPYNLALESTTAGGSGTARVNILVTFRINPLREVQYHYSTNYFVIEP